MRNRIRTLRYGRTRLDLEILEGRNLPSTFQGETLPVPDANASGQLRTADDLTVVSTSLRARVVVQGALTQISVRFSQAIDTNIFRVAPEQDDGGSHPAFIENAVGRRFFLEMTNYHRGTQEATFILVDHLPTGAYTLHLSGPGGIVARDGEALVGNHAGGDHVVPFAIVNHAGVARGRTLNDADDSFANPTDLGVLFNNDVRQGITIRRDFRDSAETPSDEADYFRFTVLKDELYTFQLTGPDLSVATLPVLLDKQGRALSPEFDPRRPGQLLHVYLAPGTYTIRVGRWDAASAKEAVYTLRAVIGVIHENPTPLHAAPSSSLRLQLGSPSVTQPAPTLATPMETTFTTSARLVLPAAPISAEPGVRFVVAQKPVEGAPLSVSGPNGAFSGLSAAPQGVIAGSEGTIMTTPRLALPGSDAILDALVTLEDAETEAARHDDPAVYEEAFEAFARQLFLAGMSWLRTPIFTPGLSLYAPSDDDSSDDNVAPPAVGDQARALGDSLSSPIGSAAAILAFIGLAAHDKETRRQIRVAAARQRSSP